jgi:hypothetical protein
MFACIAGKAFNCFRSEMLKMGHNELDSFFLKFKNLRQAGWNAKLTLDSNHGKLEVNLSVELGDAHVFRKSKNSPSRQRRRARRSAAQDAAKKAACDNGQIVATAAGKVAEGISTAEKSTAKATETTPIVPPLEDEVCADHDYLENGDDDDTFVEEILLEANHPEESEEESVEDLLIYNLKVLGIKMIELRINKSESGVIKSCSVIVQPTPKKIIGMLSHSLRNWNLKHCNR